LPFSAVPMERDWLLGKQAAEYRSECEIVLDGKTLFREGTPSSLPPHQNNGGT
jgi:hypothetical protein